MRLKGRKSLYTLLQETWSVFFGDDGGPVYRNTHPVEGNTGIAGKDEVNNRYTDEFGAYDFNYYSQQGRSFVDVPETSDFYNSALQGFVLGQVLGSNITLSDTIRTKAQEYNSRVFCRIR